MPLKDCLKKASLHPTLEANLRERADFHRGNDKALSEEESFIKGIKELQAETIDSLVDIYRQLGIADYDHAEQPQAAPVPQPAPMGPNPLIDELNEIFKEKPKAPKKPAAPKPSGEEKKYQSKIRDEKVQQDIDDAWKDFMKPSGNLTSGGLDPQKLEAGVKLVGLYVKAGVYKFSDILSEAYDRLGERLHEFVDAIKVAYNAYYNQATDEEAKLMDSSVREIKLDDIIAGRQKLKGNPEQQSLEPGTRRQFVDQVKRLLTNGLNPKITINTLRKIADVLNMKAKDTELQEMAELAIVETAREIAESPLEDKERFDKIVFLYENQPTISMRSSERIAKQQYSTPIPMGFVMGKFINRINPSTVLEPSAGNGMLVFAIPSKKVIVNEIDPVRLEMLEEQNFMVVTSMDATRRFAVKADGVIMNPPFGKAEPREFDGVSIRGLDEQMIANTLQTLNPNGRAAIIMGGHASYDEKGRMRTDRVFFNYLYNRYNVVDVINVDGDLYSKQGTSFPTRIILIDGVKAAKEGVAPLEDKEATKPITSFNDLYDRIQKTINYEQRKPGSVPPPVDTKPDTGNTLPDRSTSGQGGQNQGKGPGVKSPSSQDQLLDITGQKGAGEAPSDDHGLADHLSGASDTRGGEFDASNPGNGAVQQGQANIPGEQPADTNIGGRSTGTLQPGESVSVSDRAISILEDKVPYEPKSQSKSVETVVPSQMATETYNSLDAIEQIYGDIDDFVQGELGYATREDLFKALSGEQVDAVALSIHQLNNQQGMIIGDMTGVGKGRVAAAMIRYAVNKGYKPIFLTKEVNLYSDLYRDMIAIGSDHLKPFIVNEKNDSGDPAITMPDKNDPRKLIVVHSPITGSAKKTLLATDRLPDNFDYSLVTYSQLRTDMSKPSRKRDWFFRHAQANIIIMDESHMASGTSNSGKVFQAALPATNGVVFLSATFAKKPNNMPVYAMKTAMADAQLTHEELVAAIEKGGVALQEIVAANLVQSGQMIRRERTFDGVKVEYITLDEKKEEHRKIADGFTSIIRDIIDFEKKYVQPIFDEMDDDEAPGGGFVTQRPGVEMLGIANQPFVSKIFNVINQMIFAIKAKDIAQVAIQHFKDNKKPVIGFLNTMQAFLDAMGIATGERLDKADFSMVLKRGLDGTFRFTVNDSEGVNHPGTLTIDDLSPEAQARYKEIVDSINKTTSGVYISPIDVIIKELQDAGMRVGEITGRSRYLEIQPDGSSIVKKREDKNKNNVVNSFNNGDLDAVLLNAAGATGLSLHADIKFTDRRIRTYINGQLELDINNEVQKRGRVDRTGQVQRAEFYYVASAIPAEQRLFMMFKSKLKSLDANTTSSQKSKTNIDIPDFIDHHGDEVVTQYLKENLELSEMLGDPLKFLGMSADAFDAMKTYEGAANKITGRVAILPTAQQEIFYKDIIEAYTLHLNYLKDNNENDLEVKLLPLKAKTLSSVEVIAGKGTNSPFGTATIREKIEADVLTRPMKKEEIDEQVEKYLDGRKASVVEKELYNEADAYGDAFIAEKVKIIEDRYNDTVIPEAIARAEKKDTPQDEINIIRSGLEESRDNKMNREFVKYNGIFGHVKLTIQAFHVGEVYEVPLSTRVETNTQFSKGVFLGFNIRNSATNKFTPSNIIMRFAVNDSRRLVNIPVSKRTYTDAISFQSQHISNRGDIREGWDKRISNKTRNERYMITGNLLQAYGTNDGQLVAYTTEGGAIKKGMLLNDAYDPTKQKFRTTFSQAFKANSDSIISTDKKVSITKRGGGYDLRVPLSKQEGGQYFLNPELRDLVEDNDFRQYGGNMVGHINYDNIHAALLVLDGLGVTTESEVKGGTGSKGGGGISGLSSDYQLKTKITLKQLGINEGDSFQTIVQKLAQYPGEFSNLLKFVANTPGIENIKVRNVTQADRDKYFASSGRENLNGGYIRINDNPDAAEEDKGTLLMDPDTNNQYYANVHEVMHWYTFDSGAKERYGNQKQLKDLETLYNIINRTSGGFRESLDTYGLFSFPEFLAELAINPDFRANVTPVIVENEKTYKKYAEWADKKKSFIEMVADWFKNLIRRALGGKAKIDLSTPLIDNAVRIYNNIFFGGEDFTTEQKPTGEPTEFIPTMETGAIAALPRGKSREETIRDFVKEKLKAGVSEQQIKDALMNSALGMSDEDAQSVIDEVKPPKKEPPPGTPPPPPPGGNEPGGNKPSGSGIVEERSFTKRLVADKGLLPGTRAGVERNLNYIRQQNVMSAGEAEEILTRVPPEEAFSLIAHEGDVKPAVRVVMGMALIKKYNELASSSGDEADKNYYINKSIDVADYVSEKLGTESGQMIQAFSLYSRLSPEAQLRSAVRDEKAKADHKKEKRWNDVNNIGNKFKKANEETVDEVLKAKNVKSKIEETENKKIKKAKTDIEKAQEMRANLLKRYKQNKGKNLYSTIPGLTPEGIELVAGLVKSYIQEGIANIEIIIEKVKQNLLELTEGKHMPPYVEAHITDLVSAQVQEAIDKKVTKGLKELEKQLAGIIKKHYTVPEGAKATLIDKFIEETGIEEPEATELAKQVQDEFDKIATRKKQDIIDKEVSKVSRIHKNLAGNQKVERKTLEQNIIKFSNLGAFENTELMEFIGDKLGLGKITAEQGKEIQRLAEAIQKAPEGSPKNDATQDLMAYRARMKGTNWGEVLQAVWYAEILSGYMTHIRNVVSTFFNGMAFFAAEFIRDPKSLPVLVVGGLRGFKRGLYEAWHTITTGRSPIHVSKIETPMALERVKFVGGFLNPYNYLKFVNRLMVAEDVISFQGLKEMRATQLAYRVAKQQGTSNPFSKETWKNINETLLNTKERSEEAIEQAEEEGLKKGSVEWKRRVYELMELSRPIQMTAMAYGFAAKGTFNHEPEGTLGAITNTIAQTLDIPMGGVRPLRFIVPFTRIITNVVNNSLDYTPVGLIRAARGVRGFRDFLTKPGAKTAFRKLSPEERQQLIAKSSLGIALTAAVYALTKVPCKGGHSVLEVTGGGTGNYGHDAQLKQAGWQPYSIRTCGGKYISYKLTPLVYNFALIGHFSDHEKYSKESDETQLNRWALAVYQTGQLAADATFVGSTSDFMKTVSSSTPGELGNNLEKILGNMAKQAAIPNGYTQAAQKIEQIYNIPQKQVNGFMDNLKQDIPIARNSLDDKINALGDPIVRDVDILLSKETTDPVWKFLLDKKGWVTPPPRNSFIVPTENIDFERPGTDDEYYKFAKLRGAKIKAAIQDIIDNGAYTTEDENDRTSVTTSEDLQTGNKPAAELTPKELQKLLRAISAKATKEAKKELFAIEENNE